MAKKNTTIEGVTSIGYRLMCPNTFKPYGAACSDKCTCHAKPKKELSDV